MRELDSLVVTLEDIRNCATDATHHHGDVSGGNHENTYTRARAVASNAAEYGGKKLINVVRRMRNSSRLQDSHLPLQAQVMRNLAKLEKRHENMKQKMAEAEVVNLSDFEQKLHDLITERSRMTGLPIEEPCFENHIELGEDLCIQCSAWDGYYEEIDRVLDMVEVRGSWVFTRYNPVTSISTSIKTSGEPGGERSHSWTQDNLYPVGLFIEVRALDWMIENKMNHLLQNVLGNIIVTSW